MKRKGKCGNHTPNMVATWIGLVRLTHGEMERFAIRKRTSSANRNRQSMLGPYLNMGTHGHLDSQQYFFWAQPLGA